MKRDRAKELLPIIQAFAEGKKIRRADRPLLKDCAATDDPHFDNDNVPWELAPEPEVIYFNKRNTETYSYGYPDTIRARKDAISPPEDYEYIAKKFIAVEE